MSGKTLYWILKATSAVALLLLGASLWYYTTGRKPRLLISAPFKANDASTTIRVLGRDEVLLLVGTKATLYDLANKKARWTATLSAAPAPATPAPKPITNAPAATPPPAGKPDPLLAARVKKRFAKLEKWAAALNGKRGTLKTPLQIAAFNDEAVKYHAELTAARGEAAVLHPAQRPTQEPFHEPGNHWEDFPQFPVGHRCIAALPGSVWIAHGRQVTALDRGSGRIVKSVSLPGDVASLTCGAEEIFAVAPSAASGGAQISRLVPGDDPTQQLTVKLPPEPAAEEWHAGSPPKPATPELRTLFGANGGSLLQLDVRLLEKKLTERQTIPGESGSELEAADRKTSGGFGNDALIFAQALNREAERDATGGREIIDESTYEVTLRRPFASAIPAATAQVHGHAELFSSPTLDLIVAGRELVAFDRANKKLWQAQLAASIEPVARWSAEEPAQPYLEAGDRLYFFDPAYLTSFSRLSGQPAWRLPLEHIHKLQLDEADRLYVTTRPAALGELSQLLQVEAKTGRVVWKVEKYDDCFVSGKDLYVTRETRNAEDMVNAVFDRSKVPPCRWKLYKLSTRTGEPQWEWFQTRRPSRIEADHKRVALLFADELQMLTSLAL